MHSSVECQRKQLDAQGGAFVEDFALGTSSIPPMECMFSRTCAVRPHDSSSRQLMEMKMKRFEISTRPLLVFCLALGIPSMLSSCGDSSGPGNGGAADGGGGRDAVLGAMPIG
jgi:hypothetical protein